MEYNFNCEDALGCDSRGIAILEGSFESNIRQCFKLHVKGILDLIGEQSSKEQGLNIIKTNSQKFFTSHDRIFIKADKNVVIGFLRVGKRKLFVKDDNNNYSNEEPVCVIDFHVVKSYERQGYGKLLFDKMLSFEKIVAQELAFDKLTPKMIKFLSKNYLLTKYVIQNNGFAVYSGFFEQKKKKKNMLSEYAESILYNPNMPKNFLHPEENRLFSKGNTQSPEYLGGTSLRSNNRNVNNEFLNGNINYNNSSNNNINNMSYNTNFNTYSNNNNIKPYSNYNKLGSNVPFQRNQISMDYPRQTPANKIFGSIFLNDYSNQSNNNSEFYSKRKLQMIKDYNETLNKKDESEFKSQELQKRSMEQGVNTQRIDNIERSISPTSSRFYEYNKKFDHKTVFDDKKILYNKAYYGNYYPPKINNQNIVNY